MFVKRERSTTKSNKHTHEREGNILDKHRAILFTNIVALHMDKYNYYCINVCETALTTECFLRRKKCSTTNTQNITEKKYTGRGNIRNQKAPLLFKKHTWFSVHGAENIMLVGTRYVVYESMTVCCVGWWCLWGLLSSGGCSECSVHGGGNIIQ